MYLKTVLIMQPQLINEVMQSKSYEVGVIWVGMVGCTVAAGAEQSRWLPEWPEEQKATDTARFEPHSESDVRKHLVFSSYWPPLNAQKLWHVQLILLCLDIRLACTS